MGLVVGVSGKGVQVKDGAGGKGDLLEGVGALKRVNVLQDYGKELDDVLSRGGWMEGIVGGDRRINRMDKPCIGDR